MKKQFLSLLAAAGIALCASAQGTPEKAKYVFYYIGDGMGQGQVMLTEAYNRLVNASEQPLLMMQFPVASVATSYSASSPVTDSAAAGTALSTGHKTRNGMLGTAPDTTAVISIAKKLFDDGFGVGIVTSVAPDDATPGAFYTHVPKRSMYFEIGQQMASCGYDFIGGSNLRGLKDKKTGEYTGLWELFDENNVRVVRTAEGMDTITSQRVLLLSPDTVSTNIGYTIDSIPGALTLPVMAQACLDHLQKNGRDRFFMMVEGGNIDWASHGNDGGAVVKEVLNFNQALKVAYDFYLQHPDETLIVVTADHETGGLGLGNNFSGYMLNPQYFDYQKVSKETFNHHLHAMMKSRRIYTWEDMEEYLTEKLGFWTVVPVNEEQTKMLRDDFDRCFINRQGVDQKTLYSNFDEFAVNVFKVLDAHTGIGWTTGGHTGGLVPVYAIGVGADRFKGFNDNTDLPKLILEIAQ